MAPIKALALDLDGTVLGADERFSPAVAEAVRKAADVVHVFLVTGREAESLLPFARELGLTAPQVGDNGALIVEPATGKAVWCAPMHIETAMLAVRSVIGAGYRFMATHEAGTVWDPDELDGCDLTRVTAFDVTEDQADGLVGEASGHEGLDAVKAFLPYNGLWSVNFTRSGVNKGTGLRALCGLLGVEPSEVAAVGDSFNDIPMFEVVGLPIAMGAAPSELLSLARHEVGSVEQDGLVEAVERYVLPAT